MLLLASATAVGAWIAIDDGGSDGGTAGVSAGSSTASPATDGTSSTWYCPAGTAGGSAADHVVVDNSTPEAVTGSLTVFSESPADESDQLGDQTHEFEVAPFRKLRVPLTDFSEPSDDGFLAALVEMDEAYGADVQVEHEVSGPEGVATGRCATRGASEWHFAWGATTRDARDLLVLFNPFPNDVVVDATFSTPDGVREPLRWQGLIVPARRVVAIALGEDVTRRSHVAASLRARTGSLVVERLQIFDGSLDAEGMRLASGQSAPVETATLPGADGEELVALYNPTDEVSEVEVVVRPDDPGEPEPLPFTLVLRPGQFETLDYSQEERIPSGSYETFVRSTNGVPVVAEQVLLGTAASVR